MLYHLNDTVRINEMSPKNKTAKNPEELPLRSDSQDKITKRFESNICHWV